jgi:hypothetical protein
MTLADIIPARPSDEQLDKLRHDLDSIDVNDFGVTLVLRFEPDDTGILDEQGEGMWCGRIEWSPRGSVDYVGQRSPGRPRDFDGGAEILTSDHRSALWWDVPADLRKPDMAESKSKTRQLILDILEYGYCYMSLRLYRDGDEIGHEGIGAIEPFPDREYVQEWVRELADQIFDPPDLDPYAAAAELPVLVTL